jgi:hypothetical protein
MLFKGLDLALLSEQHLAQSEPRRIYRRSADTWRNTFCEAPNTFVYSESGLMALRCYMR